MLKKKLLMNQYHPHLQTESDVKWMVWDSNLKTWNRISGKVSTKTDGTTQTIIDGGDPIWLNSIGLPGIYEESPPIAKTKINNWSYSFDDFEKMTKVGDWSSSLSLSLSIPSNWLSSIIPSVSLSIPSWGLPGDSRKLQPK